MMLDVHGCSVELWADSMIVCAYASLTCRLDVPSGHPSSFQNYADLLSRRNRSSEKSFHVCCPCWIMSYAVTRLDAVFSDASSGSSKLSEIPMIRTKTTFMIYAIRVTAGR